MQAVRRKNTKPEQQFIALLREARFRFVQHPTDLDGQPDIYFKRYKTVVFVHGCFWHGHTSCRKGLDRPKSNVRYWVQKIERNRHRDQRITARLRKRGLAVYTVWECELRKNVIPSRLITQLFRSRT